MNAKPEDTDAKQKILAAAGPIFAAKGYAETRIREICKAADVNLAAVNYHFGDKENLYHETVAYARQNRADENPLPEGDVDPETRLRQFILTLVQRVAGINEPPWEVQLILREVLFPTEACRRIAEDYFRPFFNQLLGILQELAPQKMLPETAYRLGYSIVGQIMYLRFTSKMKSMFLPAGMPEKHFQIDQIAEHVFQFSLAAIRSDVYWRSTTPSEEVKRASDTYSDLTLQESRNT